MRASDSAVTSVAHIEAPRTIVARRYPGVAYSGRMPRPALRAATACAPHGCAYPARTLQPPCRKHYHKF
jgi:hypothetical protein